MSSTAHLIHWLELTLPAEPPRPLHLQPGRVVHDLALDLIYFGFVLALPIIFWQVWAFFVPAVDQAHAG